MVQESQFQGPSIHLSQHLSLPWWYPHPQVCTSAEDWLPRHSTMPPLQLPSHANMIWDFNIQNYSYTCFTFVGSRQVPVTELGGPVSSNSTGVTFGGPPPPRTTPAPAPPPPPPSGVVSNLTLSGQNANIANFNTSDLRQRYAEVLANVRCLPDLITGLKHRSLGNAHADLLMICT